MERKIPENQMPVFTWLTARLSAHWFELFAWGFTLVIARQFFGSMHDQLLLSDAANQGLTLPRLSAPLDDVFIHFDFARATARGFPFQWSEGNGYSSGGTSLLYPLVLSLGYRIGYRDVNLMLWAGMLACASVWLFLVLTKRMLHKFTPWYALALPFLVLSVGGLNWSLFSGMEVAFFLALWAVCYVQWERFTADTAFRLGSSLAFGAACAALVGTRPESAVLVVVFALFAFIPRFRKVMSAAPTLKGSGISASNFGYRALVAELVCVGAPPFLVLLGHSLANKWFTGEWSAAGSIAKLELNSPYMSGLEVWNAWVFHLGYQFSRVTHHHLSSQYVRVEVPLVGSVVLSTGLCIWAFALAAVVEKRTRRVALLLLTSVLLFSMLVALNGQVRWQNERYAMPAVAWLLLAAGLGVAGLLEHGVRSWQRFRATGQRPGLSHWALSLATLLGLGGFARNQVEQYRDQVWFFGRAARNISDQQVAAGLALRTLRGSRVLVGDAGAIPYMSDLPALDLIGLGGYHDLPFARASRLGVAAGIELLQRIPSDQRPDLMAIYPSWWGLFPQWFGERIGGIGVRGNVICGGAEKVIYKAHFESLDGGDEPLSMGRHERVRAEVDVADLVSERNGLFKVNGAPGFVAMRLLPHPLDPARDLWDGGRVVPKGASVSFAARGLIPQEESLLYLRLALSKPVTLRVEAHGMAPTTLRVVPSGGWTDVSLTIPRAAIAETSHLSVVAEDDEAVLYHLWLTQPKK